MHEDVLKEDFFAKVIEITKSIPSGRVTTYGAIAHYTGLKRSARMVGWALNQASSSVLAHRVVNRERLLNGKLYFGGDGTIEELLKRGGGIVVNNQVEDFNSIFWNLHELIVG